MGTKDRLREAIQALSGPVERRRVFVHTGWRRVDEEWVYLHAQGAIGREGVVSDVEVQLGGGLEPFSLPAPPSGDALKRNLLHAFEILDVCPCPLSVPLLAAPFRAVLRPASFSIHLAGKTAGCQRRVVSDPNILGGKPVFRGTRLPIATLFGYLADGLSLDYYLETFPSVTREQAVAVLRYGQERIEQELSA